MCQTPHKLVTHDCMDKQDNSILYGGCGQAHYGLGAKSSSLQERLLLSKVVGKREDILLTCENYVKFKFVSINKVLL